MRRRAGNGGRTAEGARTKESWCLEEMEKVRVGFLDSFAKDGLGAGPQAGPDAGQDLQTSFLIRLRLRLQPG